ncbi:MAG: NapH/MauN family ferredoxin-type protein [Eggerthellaceae bacterium]|nr:NapH/MauN family ferredoxin-type protein [Eggerthellaceae bacterium]
MEEKKKSFPFTIVRHIVQVIVLAVFLVPVFFAGWSLFGGTVGGDNAMGTPADVFFYGSLSSSSIFGINLLDPFAFLQYVVASKSLALNALLAVLPVLVFYGLIRGRAFCGWTCPVNLLLEIIDWIRLKLKIKVEERVLPRHAKVYVAAGVLVLSLVLSFPVFEALSPISFINKGLIFGSLVGGITLLAVILVELFWGHRVWCRALCPLGGFYEVVGKVGLLNVAIDNETCIGCNKCKKACLCDPEILDAPVAGEDVIVRAGDCMLCGKCIEACPVEALSIKIGR